MKNKCSTKKIKMRRLKKMKLLSRFSKPAFMRRQKIISKTLKTPFITMWKEMEMKNLTI